MLPLFERFPALAPALPRAELATLPTPVEPLEELAAELGVAGLHVKRDDLTSERFGGNKVRKLEFLFGHALARGRRTVVTFGYAGSNHAAATALHGQAVGLRTVSLLLPQPPTRHVRDNLAVGVGAGARVVVCGGAAQLAGRTATELARATARDKRPPLVIPPGGSNPRGMSGFVNAGLELADQVASGRAVRPDVVYVPGGSLGTAAGLSLGLRLAHLDCRVVAVRVAPARWTNPRRLAKLFDRASAFLTRRCPAVPRLSFDPERLELLEGHFGAGYGSATDAGREAARRFERAGAPRMDGTYTSKAAAALVQAAGRHELAGRQVLFWHTLGGASEVPDVAPADVPRGLRRYFSEPLESFPS